MDALQTTVICACTGALGLSLAEGILPAERFRKQLRLLTAILMMTVILRPLMQLPAAKLPEFSTQSSVSTGELTEDLQKIKEHAVADSICDSLNNAFREKCIPCKVTGCDVHIERDGSIIINEVTVTGNYQTGCVYLREWLGAEIPVREEGIHIDSAHQDAP
ncbi:MAG: hypothetical protein IKQ39_03525 [Oscillospiraceae bacterium]|nr:hypothetical protein [Oscillospiraceae bacterium]